MMKNDNVGRLYKLILPGHAVACLIWIILHKITWHIIGKMLVTRLTNKSNDYYFISVKDKGRSPSIYLARLQETVSLNRRKKYSHLFN